MTSIARSLLFSVCLAAACSGAPRRSSVKAGPVQQVAMTITVQPDRELPAIAWTPGSGGPWPVVLLSHGWGGRKEHVAFLGERLAAAGYLAVAVDHLQDSAATAFRRPLDLTAVLDTLADPARAPQELVGAADLDHVAVYGHSFGGFTALALGGARMGPNPEWDAHCEAGPAMDCPAPPPGSMPTLSLRDPRVDLVLAAAPAGYFLFGDAGTAEVEVPVLIVAAGDDAVIPLDEQLRPLVAQLRSPHTLVTLAHATHMTFTDLCADATTLSEPLRSELAPQCDGTGPISALAVHAFLGDLVLAELGHTFDKAPAPDPAALAKGHGLSLQ